MFRAAFLQAVADLRQRWVQTALVFIVVTAAATVLMLALTVWTASSDPYTRALEEANAPHAWFFGNRQPLERIAKWDGVEDTAGPYTVSLNFSVNVGREREAVRFWDTGAELPEVSPALLTEGRWLDPNGEDEVVIDGGFARETGFKVGDEIVVSDESGRTALNIVGIAANFERAPYPIVGPAVFHVLPSTFERLIDGRVNAYMLGVRLEDAGETQRFVSRVDHEIPSLFTQSWQDVRDDVDEVNGGNAVFLTVFSVFALLAAGFIIANAIGGQVMAQYREIGLLKAVGFTPGGVTGLLLLENLLIAVPAALAGAALGFALSPLFLNTVASLFSASAFPALDPVVLAIVVGGVALLTIAFTGIPAWRAGHLSTLRALAPAITADGSRPSMLARIAARLRMPPLLIIAVKDAFSRPLRAALTIGALTLAVMTVTFTLMIDATLASAREDRTLFGGPPFDLQVVPRTMSDDDTEALIQANSEVASYVKAAWLEADIPDTGEHINMLGLSRDYKEIGYRIEDGRMFSGPDEAVLGLGLARKLDLSVGDTITIVLWGQKKIDLPVVGTYVEESDSGRRMMFDYESVAHVERDPRFVRFGVKLVRAADVESVRQSLLEDGGGAIDVDNMVQDWNEAVRDSRTETRTLLLPLNGILLAIVIVNLLSSLLFTVRERQRDVGILKSIGLTPTQVVGAIVIGSVMFALVAAVVGISTGTFLTSLMVDFGGEEEGWPKGIANTPSTGWLLLTALLAVAVSVIGSALPAMRAGRTRIIDALRYE